jgi:hypothetical protein
MDVGFGLKKRFGKQTFDLKLFIAMQTNYPGKRGGFICMSVFSQPNSGENQEAHIEN